MHTLFNCAAQRGTISRKIHARKLQMLYMAVKRGIKSLVQPPFFKSV